MAIENSIESLLASLTSSLQSASGALPSDDVLPPVDGISLLDIKNELLLSYVQNLVFLILLKVRARSKQEDNGGIQIAQVTQQLIESRVYLEKGVRPLETRLKYNIDKIVRAADEAARRITLTTVKRGSTKSRNDAASNSDISENMSVESEQSDDEEDEMAFAPNQAALVRSEHTTADLRTKSSARDGIYRPPKITPMAMPISQDREERRQRGPGKSATLDEFVATELSSAPMAEPSIGSTITHGGRRTKSEKDRREENERREYEEANFTRLAPKSKKEMAKQRGRERDGGFGGEEWRNLGAGIDRIERLTERKGGARGKLEKSRKRPIEDGPRGTGAAAGDAFEKRRKLIAGRRR